MSLTQRRKGAKLSAGLVALALLPATALPAAEAYRLEKIAVPKEIVLEVGGMGFWPDGRLVMCTRRGDVWVFKPGAAATDGIWTRFASGLHEPLGLSPGKAGEIFVIQRPELTRICDSDGDGFADQFETICDAWGVSGNYHEFTYGLPRDKEGNFWGTLNLAHAGDPVGKAEMGSIAPWRGWSFKVTPKGEFVPVSSGLRSPNGVGANAEGDIFCNDNQGGWVGTSMLYHLTPGAFHGHPSGLKWDKNLKSDPAKLTVEELNKMRKRPAACYPHGATLSSPSEPLCDTTAGRFGPFAGQMFTGDNVTPLLMRIALEKVDGEYQGAVFPFLRAAGLSGVNRLAFAPDGALYLGLTARGWGSGDGLLRLSWSGQIPMEMRAMTLTKQGFDITFTKPVDAATAAKPDVYSLQHYHYHYHANYGSPQVDPTPVKVSEVKISGDKRRVSLVLPELVTGKIYELHLKGVKAADGEALGNTAAYYTLNRKVTDDK